MSTTGIELLYLDIISPKFFEAFRYLLDLDISIPEALALTKTMDVIDKENKNLHSVEFDLVKKYGVPSPKKEGVYKIEGTTPEKHAEFDEKYKELLNQSFSIPLINKIVLTKDSGKIKTSHLYLLQKLVEVK